MAVERRTLSAHRFGSNWKRWALIAFVFALEASCSRSANAQTLAGTMFAGAGVFKCCQGHTGAWQVGGGVDVPVAARVSVGGDFSLVGPIGDGRVSYPFGYALFGTGSLLSFNGSYHFNRHDAHRPRPFPPARKRKDGR